MDVYSLFIELGRLVRFFYYIYFFFKTNLEIYLFLCFWHVNQQNIFVNKNKRFRKKN